MKEQELKTIILGAIAQEMCSHKIENISKETCIKALNAANEIMEIIKRYEGRIKWDTFSPELN